jgi:hypothetical protein
MEQTVRVKRGERIPLTEYAAAAVGPRQLHITARAPGKPTPMDEKTRERKRAAKRAAKQARKRNR